MGACLGEKDFNGQPPLDDAQTLLLQILMNALDEIFPSVIRYAPTLKVDSAALVRKDL